MRSRRFVFVLLVIITLTGGYLIGCATGGEQHHVDRALTELRAARSELEAAGKADYRGMAITLIDRATAEVQKGTEFANAH